MICNSEYQTISLGQCHHQSHTHLSCMGDHLRRSQSEEEVHNNRHQEEEAKHCRTKSVIVWARPSLSDGHCSPVVGDEGIHHCGHGDECE